MKRVTIKGIMADFLDSIREYEHESGEAIYFDERESSEFVDIYSNSEGKLKIEEKEQMLKRKEKSMISENDIKEVESIKPPLLIASIDSMLFLIDSIRETDKYISDIYLNGGCYKFHLMLKKFTPECEARITKERNHIVTYFKGRYFDITGIVEGQFEPLNNYEIEMASKWSFAKNRALQICECPACEEPIVV